MMTVSKIFSAVAVSLVLTTCARSPAPKSTSIDDRLGGQPAITAVVDDSVDNAAADKRINGQFANANLPRLKMLLVEQICAGTGGPCRYTGCDMKSADAHLRISDADFTVWAQDLSRTLDKFKVPDKERSELMAILVPGKGDIQPCRSS